jgi:tRNA modification GTPase
VPTTEQPDTIAAIATGLGGGVGIVRLSGPRAEAILAQLVRPWPKGRPPSHKLQLGRVHDPRTGEPVDQVLAVVMRAPRSYTGEDVAELHGHGGVRMMQRLLDCAIAAGARLAEPGEFTRRAFEAGRIDLTRAEAVAELIAARSDRALRVAQTLAGGALEGEVRELRGRVVNALAELEGALDFPDERLDAAPPSESARGLVELSARTRALAGTYRKFVHERAEVVLLGRVNAGKSSLFNALLGQERALVDAGAGTTRDVLEAELDLDGVSVRLVDTAGERISSAEAEGVEKRGVELGRKRRAGADAVVLVVDGEQGFGQKERELWRELGESARVIAWNKRDRGRPTGLPEHARVVETTATTADGVPELRAALREALGADEPAERGLHVSRRHQQALLDAADAMERARALLEHQEPGELAAIELRDALHHLGRVTGETVDAEVLDAIFSRFCIGK